MALYSSETSLDCHRVRFVLAEKGINVDIVNVSVDESAAADLAELNPYNQAPTLVDRDLVLYDAGVINDYLDERYPHPPLMPVDPVSRAKLRLVHYRVQRDWYSLAREIEANPGKVAEQAARQLKESIIAANELFKMAEYVLSDELSLVDCTLGPLLWRLSSYGVKLGKPGTSVEAYAHRIFSKDSFKASLTQAERDLILGAA
jgi:RNA polymerase-associated protein